MGAYEELKSNQTRLNKVHFPLVLDRDVLSSFPPSTLNPYEYDDKMDSISLSLSSELLRFDVCMSVTALEVLSKYPKVFSSLGPERIP